MNGKSPNSNSSPAIAACPPDDLPRPARLAGGDCCPTCGFPAGQPGFIREDLLPGHPNWGKAIPCPDCHDRNQARRHAAMSRHLNGVEGWLEKATFETYEVTDDNRHGFEAALDFARNPVGLLTLWGPNGPGKTHLLAAIHNHLARRGITSLYTTMPDLVSRLRVAVGEGDPEDFYQFVSRYRILLIDEVDKADLRNWTREQSFRLFNRRYNNFQSSGTVMAMNKNPKVYSEEMNYLFSRMNDDRCQNIYVGGVAGADNRNQASLLQRLAHLKKLVTQ